MQDLKYTVRSSLRQPAFTAVAVVTLGLRQKEFGLRVAICASRGRLVRQLLTESVVLALFAVRSSTSRASYGVAATLLVVAFIASAVPALRATRIDPVDAMRGE